MIAKLLLLLFLGLGGALPLPKTPRTVEESLDRFLQDYYDAFIKDRIPDDPYDQMQGDQPRDPDLNLTAQALTAVKTVTPEDIRKAQRNKDRETWMERIKEKILMQVGRLNDSSSTESETMRSFFPICESSEDMPKSDNIMNLFFNFDHMPQDEYNYKIVSATLRLYRVPSNSSFQECDNSTEDESFLRVSIYWYGKGSKGKKLKRKMAGSKMISEKDRWIELDVKQAARAWNKGKNLGLAVQVEDQDSNTLRADKFYVGALCSPSSPTPKPVPTILVDAMRQSSEFKLNGSFAAKPYLSPIIEVCILQYPKNSTKPSSPTAPCSFKKLVIDNDRVERVLSQNLQMPDRHIRHKQHHHNLEDQDLRYRMVNQKIILRNEEWRRWHTAQTDQPN